MRDRRFDNAFHSFCADIPAWFRQDPRRVAVFGDAGQVSVVASGFALQADGGVTRARIIAIVSGNGLASARRVRAICDNMERLGVVAPAPGRHGYRDKPLCFGGWLETALVDWLEILVRAAAPWIDRTVPIDAATLARLFYHRVDALDRHGFDLAAGWPEIRFFQEHEAGYAILLDLASQDAGSPGVSRKGLSRAYGVSRFYVAGLIARAEERGWIESKGDRRAISLTPATRSRLRQWIARELAAVVVALETERRY